MNNTSKSTGIVELLDYLKIDSENAIAIGNGIEDIPMMDVVKTSIAVENAHPKLKEIVSIKADSSQNDGVAKIINEIIIEKGDINER